MNLLKEAIKEEIIVEVRGIKKALKELFSFLKIIPLKIFKIGSVMAIAFIPAVLSFLSLVKKEYGIGFFIVQIVIWYIGNVLWVAFCFSVHGRYTKLLKKQKMEITRQEMKEESG